LVKYNVFLWIVKWEKRKVQGTRYEVQGLKQKTKIKILWQVQTLRETKKEQNPMVLLPGVIGLISVYQLIEPLLSRYAWASWRV